MPSLVKNFPHLPPTFLVREALASGVGKGALRNRALTVPYHGVRSAVPEDIAPGTVPGSANERMLGVARLFQPRLRPGEAVSHTSALLIYGCPLRVAPDLHVTSQPTHSRSRVRGVHGHEWAAEIPITSVGDIPLALPGTAIAQSAGLLSLRALIVAIDHLRRPRGFGGQRPALLDVSTLAEDVRISGGRGVRKVLVALELSRDGAESRMETLTRLLLLAYGLDTYFAPQVEISDDDGVIGRFDLVDVCHATIVEFDGDQHRTDKAQYERDLKRLDRARASGYRVIRLLSNNVVSWPHETANRIASALSVELLPHPLRSELLEERHCEADFRA